MRADDESYTEKRWCLHLFQELLLLKRIRYSGRSMGKLGTKFLNITSLYKLFSQTKDQVESFADNLGLNLDIIINPYLTAVLRDLTRKEKRCLNLIKILMRKLNLAESHLSLGFNN